MKNHHGTSSSIPTTLRVAKNVHGVVIASRHEIASEYDGMAAMVEAVAPSLRQFVKNIRCDSTAMACYSVLLKPCSDDQARLIAVQLEEACISGYGGYNSITIQCEKVAGTQS